MLLLVTGASGAGKSTARRAIASAIGPSVDSIEFADVVRMPSDPTISWRQRSVEFVVKRAIRLQAEGRHLLLCGDPVVAGELLAVPSAPKLEAIAICLLDVGPEQQRERLAGRGDPEELFIHHLAFAEWMRGHARDPQHRPEVITATGWKAMRWDRWRSWQAGDPRWRSSLIDTSRLGPDAVSDALLRWSRDVLEGQGPPILAGAWWRHPPS